MAEIKAIETFYNGYRFRSRLEARWAVFFDALHIKYEYEPEGYHLSNGTNYLPDFFLPDFNVFAEVKPNITPDTIVKNSYGDLKWETYPGYKTLEQLCEDTQTGGILLRGAPFEVWYQVVLCDATDSGGGDWIDEPCATFAMTAGREVVILVNDARDRAFYARDFGRVNHVVNYRDFIPPYTLSTERCMHVCMEWNNDDLSEYKPYLAAVKARQARFEHGEKPNFN